MLLPTSLAHSLLALAAFCLPASAAPAASPTNVNTVLDPNGTKLGAVASEKNTCSDMGTDLLRQGGNAADAMAGTVVCIGVTSMYHSGIGGGGFMLVRAPNGDYEFIDFRETAPASFFRDVYKGDVDASLYGGLARYVWTRA